MTTVRKYANECVAVLQNIFFNFYKNLSELNRGYAWKQDLKKLRKCFCVPIKF